MSPAGQAIDETAWWFSTAEATFAFLLKDFGATIVERHYHFKGNYIIYRGDGFKFAIECGSDWNRVGGDLVVWRPDGSTYRSKDIAEALTECDPAIDWLFEGDSGPLDREAVAAAMDLWATGLRAHLRDLLLAAAA